MVLRALASTPSQHVADLVSALDRIALCTGYRVHGDPVHEFPADSGALDGVEPEYEWCEG